ncbi:PE domain-containing protein, partial [Mycobacterium riyadhense]
MAGPVGCYTATGATAFHNRLTPAAAFHGEFTRTLTAGAGRYATAEAA